jgi:hypothetical protein
LIRRLRKKLLVVDNQSQDKDFSTLNKSLQMNSVMIKHYQKSRKKILMKYEWDDFDLGKIDERHFKSTGSTSSDTQQAFRFGSHESEGNLHRFSLGSQTKIEQASCLDLDFDLLAKHLKSKSVSVKPDSVYNNKKKESSNHNNHTIQNNHINQNNNHNNYNNQNNNQPNLSHFNSSGGFSISPSDKFEFLNLKVIKSDETKHININSYNMSNVTNNFNNYFLNINQTQNGMGISFLNTHRGSTGTTSNPSTGPFTPSQTLSTPVSKRNSFNNTNGFFNTKSQSNSPRVYPLDPPTPINNNSTNINSSMGTEQFNNTFRYSQHYNQMMNSTAESIPQFLTHRESIPTLYSQEINPHPNPIHIPASIPNLPDYSEIQDQTLLKSFDFSSLGKSILDLRKEDKFDPLTIGNQLRAAISVYTIINIGKRSIQIHQRELPLDGIQRTGYFGTL